MDRPRPLFHLFLVFSNQQNTFYSKSKRKMSCPSSIRCWDSNPGPLFKSALSLSFFKWEKPGLFSFILSSVSHLKSHASEFCPNLLRQSHCGTETVVHKKSLFRVEAGTVDRAVVASNISVTRFGEITPIWQYSASLWAIS